MDMMLRAQRLANRGDRGVAPKCMEISPLIIDNYYSLRGSREQPLVELVHVRQRLQQVQASEKVDTRSISNYIVISSPYLEPPGTEPADSAYGAEAARAQGHHAGDTSGARRCRRADEVEGSRRDASLLQLRREFRSKGKGACRVRTTTTKKTRLHLLRITHKHTPRTFPIRFRGSGTSGGR